jgi:hypothetical protein
MSKQRSLFRSLRWTVVVYLILAMTFSCLSSYFSPLAQAVGTSYYVSASGSDANNGLSTSTPFQTIQRAANLTNPGDTVYIMNGTYTHPAYTGGAYPEAIVEITRSGSAGNYITYKAYPGHSPLLRATHSWTHITVEGASYIRIEGLQIQGNNDNITYDAAYAQRYNTGNAPTNTNGIYIRRNDAKTTYPHHIEIRNNTIYKCPGAGIGSEYADYLTIDNNNVHSNSWYTVYATSGISLFHLHDTDNYTGYKNFVRSNISYNNETYIPWNATGYISDGNGIIIDDNKHIQDNQSPYNGRTLVANNLVFSNGGSGIHSYSSSHVDIVNNTAYLNARSSSLNWANIFADSSSDVNILNNISYARSGKPSNTNYSNTNVTYDYNIYYNGNTPAVSGSHDVVADPKFVNPSESAGADFHVQASSPSIDSGTSAYAPSYDYSGNSRPLGSIYDRGAYEWGTSNGSRAATATIQAESYDSGNGVTNYTTVVGNFDNSDWVRYNHVNFGAGVTQFTANVAVPASFAGQQFELRLDNPSGPLIGSLTLSSTGSWSTFSSQSVVVTGANGIHTLYIVGKGSYGIGNMDWFKFS